MLKKFQFTYSISSPPYRLPKLFLHFFQLIPFLLSWIRIYVTKVNADPDP
jgi:hypothetical protein